MGASIYLGKVLSAGTKGCNIVVASTTPAIDPDAQAFITAAGITNPTQQAAINTLVVDLKGYSIWTKMKALYPFVGGDATKHSFNLKNPAQFQINWNGGITHSANGVLFGGVNGWANTNLSPSSILSANNNHVSVYSRTAAARTNVFATDWGQATSTSGDNAIYGFCRRSSNLALYAATNAAGSGTLSASNTNGSGMYVNSITSATSRKIYRNTSTLATLTTNISQTLSAFNIAIGALNSNNVATLYSDYQAAFFSIGDGLTDTEAANFYTAVQAFQTTLGRSIGTQTVSDADAQAFVTNADIQDQVEANAINNLVIGLKADGLWTKMKAIYPFVGGTATTNKFNLKNPLDTNAAFRLVFNGGWTHSANGATPNGTNGYADTFFIPSTHLTTSSAHFSKYNRTNDLAGSKADGVRDGQNNTFFQHNFTSANICIGEVGGVVSYIQTDSRGLFTGVRTATNVSKVFKNSTQQGSTNTTTITALPQYNLILGARGDYTPSFAAGNYNSYQCAFASIGDGLTDTDAANFYTAVQAFQVALSRNI